MPSEKERGALSDMLRHIDLAERFADGLDRDGLSENLQALYARRLSDELKARHSGIPWRDMAAAGNFYRHNYEDVTARRVWKTLQDDLPPLRAAIDEELVR